MHGTRRKLIIGVAATALLIGAVATGRHLLAGGSGPSSTGAGAATGHGPAGAPRSSARGPAPVPAEASPGVARASGSATRPASGLSTPAGSGASTPGKTSSLPVVPVSAVTPQVVHTATVDMRVGRGTLDSVLGSIATLAGVDGGYVDSSSVSGGTVRRSPDAGTIVFRVLDSDFAGAIATVTHLGTVDDQEIKGNDVTVQEAQNTASISVLQDEVTLLENKLAQAPDIGTFLQIQSQLFPVEQQLQRLQAAQAVLVNSAALATVTVNLTAPGASVAPAATPRPPADAATVAWRYLRHNSLAVLDALAVAGGWALPVLVLVALSGGIAWRLVRRRRHAVAAS